VIGNLVPGKVPVVLPPIASAEEVTAWLHENALRPFLEEVKQERFAEIERVKAHVDFSLSELIQREDDRIGKVQLQVERGVEGAAGNVKQAEDRHAELLNRRERRRAELSREAALSL
jgi:hypothetical protein